jgi:hypothetical protein
LDYQGGGLTEYQFYNATTKKWDASACAADNTKRCAKMDCHLSVRGHVFRCSCRVKEHCVLTTSGFYLFPFTQNTHYQLLGFFKEENPLDFLDVLFQHQGSCTWSETDYSFMTSGLYELPQGCTATGVYDKTNTNKYQLYMDLKPASSGRIDIGLYINSKCSIEYTGSMTVDEITQKKVSANDDGSSSAAVFPYSSLAQWNNGLAAFQTCQPCRTFDLSSNNNNNNADGGDNVNDPFTCNDAAGNSGVNQCSAFAQKTDMYKASLHEITTSTLQGGMIRTNTVADGRWGWWGQFGFLLTSSLIFLVGLLSFCAFAKTKRKRIFAGINPKEPLLE